MKKFIDRNFGLILICLLASVTVGSCEYVVENKPIHNCETMKGTPIAFMAGCKSTLEIMNKK
jgi:hypothetical protein